MLKETETEKTTGFNVTFLSLVAFHLPVGPTELGVGVCPPGYAYALALICKKPCWVVGSHLKKSR